MLPCARSWSGAGQPWSPVLGRGLTDGFDAGGCRTAAPGEAKTEDQLRYESWAKFRDQQCGVVPAGKEDHLKRGFWVKLMDREYGEAKAEDQPKYEYWAQFRDRRCGGDQARKEDHLKRGLRTKLTDRERGEAQTEDHLKYEYWAKFRDRQCGDDQELDGDKTTMKVILLIGHASLASAVRGLILKCGPVVGTTGRVGVVVGPIRRHSWLALCVLFRSLCRPLPPVKKSLSLPEERSYCLLLWPAEPARASAAKKSLTRLLSLSRALTRTSLGRRHE